MLISVCTWENVIAYLKKQSSLFKVFQQYYYREGSKAAIPLKKLLREFGFAFQTPRNLKYGTNQAIIFHVLVKKNNKFYGAMMDQKIEYNFRFKKRLNLMYVNQFFRSLLAFKCFAIFCDQKCVRDFPLKGFRLQMFYFQALRNTFQCSYFFNGLHYCEKANEKRGQILQIIMKAMISKKLI